MPNKQKAYLSRGLEHYTIALLNIWFLVIKRLITNIPQRDPKHAYSFEFRHTVSYSELYSEHPHSPPCHPTP